MEKAYRDFGHDIDNTDCPLEVGLGFARRARQAGRLHRAGGDAGAPRQRGTAARTGWCRCCSTDPEPLLYHAEPVLRDGEVVGYVRAASYGWTLGGAVGLAFVGRRRAGHPDWLADGSWEVDVAGTRHPAEVSLRPMYDPTSARVTG